MPNRCASEADGLVGGNAGVGQPGRDLGGAGHQLAVGQALAVANEGVAVRDRIGDGADEVGEVDVHGNSHRLGD
jgi:hypothetical protein